MFLEPSVLVGVSVGFAERNILECLLSEKFKKAKSAQPETLFKEVQLPLAAVRASLDRELHTQESNT